MLKIIFLLFFSQSLFAGETQNTAKLPELETSNWFFLISAGMGYSNHDSVDNNAIEAKKNLGATNIYSGSADFPVIYYRLRNGDLLGVGFHVLVQNFSLSYLANEEIVFHNYNYDASYLRFFSGRVGVGLFARGDLGYSDLWRIVKTAGAFSQDRYSGINSGLAVGYGWELPNGMHFLISIDQTYVDVGTHFMSGNSFNVSFML